MRRPLSKSMVITDSGFWLGVLDQSDRFHSRAVSAWRRHGGQGWITTWAVVTETCHLIGRRLGEGAKAEWLAAIGRREVEIFDLTYADCARAASLVLKYRDLPMDFADASLVILAEHLGHGRILSADQRDFEAFRFKNARPFENLLFQS